MRCALAQREMRRVLNSHGHNAITEELLKRIVSKPLVPACMHSCMCDAHGHMRTHVRMHVQVSQVLQIAKQFDEKTPRTLRRQLFQAEC